MSRKGNDSQKTIYCGPSVRGVAQAFTVFEGELPQRMREFLERYPAARELVVPLERFAQVRRELEQKCTPGCPPARAKIVYEKLRTELEKRQR